MNAGYVQYDRQIRSKTLVCAEGGAGSAQTHAPAAVIPAQPAVRSKRQRVHAAVGGHAAVRAAASPDQKVSFVIRVDATMQELLVRIVLWGQEGVRGF